MGCPQRKPVSAEVPMSSPDSSSPQTMVDAKQTSTAVTASGGMVWYEHIEDSQEQAQVVSVMRIWR